MAFSAVAFNPMVLEFGGARIDQDQKKTLVSDGDHNAGEFLRYNVAGQVIVAADGVKSINGYAIKNYDASEDGAVFWPHLVIAEDTIFAGQYNSTAPTQALIGSRRDLVVSSNLWGVDTTQGNDPQAGTPGNLAVEITGIWLNDNDYASTADEAGAYGIVYFKILGTKLNKAPEA